jgi:hypothetical protein
MAELEKSRRAVRPMPRWVKGFIAAGIALLLLVVVLLASGHGPWQHMGMH